MFKKLLNFVLLVNAVLPVMVSAQQAQKDKNPNTFASAAGVAASTTGALCAAAGYSLSKENPYVAGGCLLASAATPLAVGKLVELSKNESLTTQEAFQLGFADFFTTIGASALLMYSFAEKPWIKGGLFALCAAKCAYLIWRASQLSAPEETTEEEPATVDTTHIAPITVPSEIKVITPHAVQSHKPMTTCTTSTYPWFGGDKPDHHDAFVLMGN